MTRLLLVRHGETEWNVRGLFQGHLDSPLTARGLEQARVAALALEGRGAERLVASDLGRCVATARLIGRHLDLEVTLDARLRELDMGRLAGRSAESIRAEPGYRASPDWRFPGGECHAEMRARVLEAVRAWSDDGRTTVFVSHAGPIRTLLQLVHGWEFETMLGRKVPPTEVHELDGGAFR